MNIHLERLDDLDELIYGLASGSGLVLEDLKIFLPKSEIQNIHVKKLYSTSQPDEPENLIYSHFTGDYEIGVGK